MSFEVVQPSHFYDILCSIGVNLRRRRRAHSKSPRRCFEMLIQTNCLCRATTKCLNMRQCVPHITGVLYLQILLFSSLQEFIFSSSPPVAISHVDSGHSKRSLALIAQSHSSLSLPLHILSIPLLNCNLFLISYIFPMTCSHFPLEGGANLFQRQRC